MTTDPDLIARLREVLAAELRDVGWGSGWARNVTAQRADACVSEDDLLWAKASIAAMSRIRADTMEEACKKICRHCNNERPLSKRMVHSWSDGDKTTAALCAARAIRALAIAKEKTNG